MSIGNTASLSGASQEVLSAIRNASRKTGVDFSYLVNQARTESSFRPDAKAKTSSATGLYQFIDQTWLATVKQHGSKHGLGDYANAIEKDFQGRYFVADDALRDRIMTLRENPQTASLMAAEFAAQNQTIIETKIGRDATATDLYFAHFLGAGGASKFLSAMEDDPDQAAAPLMKSAANANKNIFYNTDGSMKSLKQVYNNFEGKFAGIKGTQTETVTVSQATDKSYRVDPQFSGFYTRPVNDLIDGLPSMASLKTGDVFSSFFTNAGVSRLQNQVVDPVSFLMLTQLDMPR